MPCEIHGVHDLALRERARALGRAGASPATVAARLGLPTTTVYRWLTSRTPTDRQPPPTCFVCNDRPPLPAYAYLLGQYLGDGHLVTSARVPVLRIYACTDYPSVQAEISVAIGTVRGRPPGTVTIRSSSLVVAMQSYWTHWPCVLPQHGPGHKHSRSVELADWQRPIIAADPWPLIRGLIHSDGCRALNRVVVRGKPYEYPRYFFANESRDILAIMGWALDLVGVQWRYNRPNSISVAGRASVGLLDTYVGPKA
ncbi:MAG TPA: helix-turn-helix domain-containing protein [Jatrophihabitantaceae bacterium]